MKPSLLILLFCLLATSCKSPEARLPESVKSGSFLKESAERNKKLNEIERSKIQAIIDADTERAYIASESGFWYVYNKKNETDSITPQFGDTVNFDYTISQLDGTPIYTEAHLGNRTYVIDKEELFTGLREGLKLMKPSENITFIFPSQVAYGYYGDENKIGTNVPLICEVTLNTITQNTND
ncbi:MAG: gliding motility-associated peptidyl-prolyl isomerase GldI [Winogradskyella sp.]|nr:gliding motility-associated peptidyl-prolyl isomerase GldI [Winogradskyella sp.]MBT8376611.1 gliding motility-associated peptidyl-prolyl isomerase GldI [Bacteroidia bacterium]NNC46351.1 gliding motility-associated peptidyl-prolyl isomerase GldI [Winogradskyella sp.]NNL82027.1 gliding motility-associated peptidyl-prolyl isomerase GldI [Winogradskyella sp.]